MKHVPPGDHNPDRIRCALCGDTKSREQRILMLPGPICQSCYDRVLPEQAPYWRDWERLATPGQRTTLGHGR